VLHVEGVIKVEWSDQLGDSGCERLVHRAEPAVMNQSTRARRQQAQRNILEMANRAGKMLGYVSKVGRQQDTRFPGRSQASTDVSAVSPASEFRYSK
jgi:hypothetical protein